jgi:hypothetical protein
MYQGNLFTNFVRGGQTVKHIKGAKKQLQAEQKAEQHAVMQAKLKEQIQAAEHRRERQEHEAQIAHAERGEKDEAKAAAAAQALVERGRRASAEREEKTEVETARQAAQRAVTHTIGRGGRGCCLCIRQPCPLIPPSCASCRSKRARRLYLKSTRR